MKSANEGKDDGLSLFSFSTSLYYYRVAYRINSGQRTVRYNSIHELILNLSIFKGDNTVTYVVKDDDQDFITIPISKLRYTLAESLYTVTNDQLEYLYFRLLLTNKYGSIPDRGRFMHYDFSLRKFASTIRGGLDFFVSYEDRRVVLRLKYRRLSSVHLYSTIVDMAAKEEIDVCHINIPTPMQNDQLLVASLQLHIKKEQLRIYHYNPIQGAENDRLLETNLSSQLIQVFNQLLK